MINSIYSNSNYYTLQTTNSLLNKQTTASASEEAFSLENLSASSTDSSTDSTYIPLEDHFGMMQSYQQAPSIPSVSTEEDSEDTTSSLGSIDTDGDGTISADEYDDFMEALGISNPLSSDEFFAQYDTDSDGEITAAEMDASKPAGPPPQEESSVLSSSIDADGDGTISTDEYDELMEEMGITNPLSADEFFAQYDTDSDGEITAAEMEASKPAAPPVASIPAEEETQSFSSDIDTDGDGVISTAEYEAFVSQLGTNDALSSDEFFSEYDTDSNEELTADEITTAYNNYVNLAASALGAYESNYEYMFDQNDTLFNTAI